jgi:hypothetical protein
MAQNNENSIYISMGLEMLRQRTGDIGRCSAAVRSELVIEVTYVRDIFEGIFYHYPLLHSTTNHTVVMLTVTVS